MSKNRNTFHNIQNKSSQWGLVALIIVLFFSLQPAPAVHAAGITVNTTVDEYGTGGDCSLREAIQAANDGVNFGGCTPTGSGAYVIDLPAGTYTLTRTGVGEDSNATGDLDITSDITISGDPTGTTIIDGDGIDRVLHTGGTGTVIIEDLTITGGEIGTIANNGGTEIGGGIYRQSSGNLTLNRVKLSNNLAGHRGGGLENANAAGIVTLNNCIVSGNESNWGGGLVSGTANTETIINNSTFSDNTAHINGGGLNIYFGTMTVNNSTFTGNHGPGNGAGMANRDTLTVNNSTITGNDTTGNGGGIYTYGGTTTVNNSTITGNIATGNGDGINTIGGGATEVSNSIVSNNGTVNCVGVTDDGNNLEYPNTTCEFTVQADPLLGTLTNNGGDTQTHALGIGSPAIDAGDTCISTDQRGETRDDLACDIGAFELKYTDSDTVIRTASNSAITTYGPTLVGIQRGTGTDPGEITVLRADSWASQGPESIGAWWDITPTTVATDYDLTLQLCYTVAELGTLTETDLRFWHYEGGIWSQVGVAPTLTTVSGYRCATMSGVNELSIWSLATGSPTAVSLQSITATSQPISWIILLFSVLMLTIGGVWLRHVKR